MIGTGAGEESMAFLREVHDRLRNGDITGAMSGLQSGLVKLRGELPRPIWRKFIGQTCVPHPLCALLHEDPFTRHAFDKPRGYPGDAHLIDYIYGDAPTPEETSVVGKMIHAFTCDSAAPRNVRARRDLLAKKVDGIAERVQHPRILSVACGHMREAALSVAVQSGQVGEYIGLDQDRDSVALVNAGAKPGSGIRAVVGSVSSLLSGKSDLGMFDFVYSAGLYDYLDGPIAKRLTSRLFWMLKPGGELLIGNFAPCLPDIGYMEAFMAWDLIYRDEADVLRLLGELPETAMEDARLFRAEACTNNNVVYLSLTKSN